MKKIIFLDRDGVINKDPAGWTPHSYVTKWEDFLFLPGSVEALRKLNAAGYDIVIVSNQGGISRGFYTEEKLEEINNNILKELGAQGVRILKVYYCVHQTSDNCECKKPKTGLFRKAEKELGIKAAGAYFIGDGKMDIEAGRKIDLKTILVLSGKTDPKDLESWEIKPDLIFKDLHEAVEFIVKEGANV